MWIISQVLVNIASEHPKKSLNFCYETMNCSLIHWKILGRETETTISEHEKYVMKSNDSNHVHAGLRRQCNEC